MSEFTYCLNASTIRPTPLLDKVRIAGETGYQAIELWNDEVDAYLADGGNLRELKSRLDDAGLRVASMIALFGWITASDAELPGVLSECRRKMEQAAALGCPYAIASPPQEVVDIELAANRYAQLLGLGRDVGVLPSMEFLGFTDGINSLALANAIADGSRDPEATIVADVYHMIRGGGSIDDLLSIPGERMAIFHINDLPTSPPPLTQTDNDRVMLGEGFVDLPRVVAHLRTIGYRGAVSLELFNPSLWVRDPREVARIGMERMKGLLG
jgi:2-keto-myo-inositol isomerase